MRPIGNLLWFVSIGNCANIAKIANYKKNDSNILCFSVHGGVDRRRRHIVVDGGREEQDTRAAAATSESGFGAGMNDAFIAFVFAIETVVENDLD